MTDMLLAILFSGVSGLAFTIMQPGQPWRNVYRYSVMLGAAMLAIGFGLRAVLAIGAP